MASGTPSPEHAIPLVVSWSGGKDSLLALEALLQQPAIYDVRGLLTTYCDATRRSAIHGIPLSLIEQQAEALRLPLLAVPLPKDCPNTMYEEILGKVWGSLKREQIATCAFGDLFLDDIRQYREQLYQFWDVTPLFPVWQVSSDAVLRQLRERKYTAIVCSVMASLLDDRFLGRFLDDDFIRDLPEGIDLAGENGEFHSFVVDGPLFRKRIRWEASGIRDEGVYRQLVLR